MLTKDDAVPSKPVSLRSALTRRAAVVAGSAAAAALFATVPAPPAAASAVAPTSPTAVVTTPVIRLAATKPAAMFAGIAKNGSGSAGHDSLIAVRDSVEMTAGALMPGDLLRISAATPTAWGDAIDVP